MSSWTPGPGLTSKACHGWASSPGRSLPAGDAAGCHQAGCVAQTFTHSRWGTSSSWLTAEGPLRSSLYAPSPEKVVCVPVTGKRPPPPGLPPKGPSLPKLQWIHSGLCCKPFSSQVLLPRQAPVYSGRQTRESQVLCPPWPPEQGPRHQDSVSREGSTHVGSGLDLVHTDTRMHTHLLCLTSAHCLMPWWRSPSMETLLPGLPVPFHPALEKRKPAATA